MAEPVYGDILVSDLDNAWLFSARHCENCAEAKNRGSARHTRLRLRRPSLVGEGGGAASGAGQEIVKMVKRVVDGLGVLETVFALHERDEEIGVFVASFLLGQRMRAETGLPILAIQTERKAPPGYDPIHSKTHRTAKPLCPSLPRQRTSM